MGAVVVVVVVAVVAVVAVASAQTVSLFLFGLWASLFRGPVVAVVAAVVFDAAPSSLTATRQILIVSVIGWPRIVASGGTPSRQLIRTRHLEYE